MKKVLISKFQSASMLKLYQVHGLNYYKIFAISCALAMEL